MPMALFSANYLFYLHVHNLLFYYRNNVVLHFCKMNSF
jgi:hypothetical protein